MRKGIFFLLVLSCIQVNAQISLPSFQGVPIPNFVTSNMLLRYEIGNTNSYNNAVSPSTVTDLIGNSNATLYNSPTFSNLPNGNLNFTSSSSQFIWTNTNLAPFFNNSSSVSVFMWVYPTGDGVILDELGTPYPTLAWRDSQIEMVSGNLKFGLWQYSSPLVSSSISTPLNSWHYIGYTYDGTSFNVYVNGKNAGSVASFARQTPYIGYGSGLYYGIGHLDVTNLGNGGYGNFKLGAMHVYGRSLSAPEVALNYNTTKSQYQIIQNGLMANLISPTNSGTIWTDLSGNGNNATLVGLQHILPQMGVVILHHLVLIFLQVIIYLIHSQ
jgi:hypothetical protein